jgi:hypothetical protein
MSVPWLDLYAPRGKTRPRCFFFEHGEYDRPGRVMPACSGRLVRCHLIAKQALVRTSAFRTLVTSEQRYAFLYDPRVWVWGCGGIMGNAGHHGAFDVARTIRVPRELLPKGLEDHAEALGLDWYLERYYGPRTSPGGASTCTAP